jgi:signal peptidase II
MRVMHRLALLAAALVMVGCDHVSKQVAKTTLEGAAPHSLIGRVLDLQYRENRDAAFELLRWMPAGARAPVLIIAGALAIAVLVVMLLRRRRLDLTTVAVLLVLAGAAGNYGDRLMRGYVIDFIHLSYWPVFNLADAYLSVGIALLLLATRVSAPAASSRRR